MSTEPAIFILANDKVITRYLMLCGSLHFFKYSNPIYIIPYDENIRLTEWIASKLGHQIYRRNLPEIDSFSKDLYDNDPPATPYPQCLGNLRKLTFLTFEGKAVYLDSDIVITSKPEVFNSIFSSIEPFGEKMSIGYINTSPTGVYENLEDAKEYIAKSHLICAGMMSKSAGALNISAIRQHMTADRKEFYGKIRRRGGHVDQPVWNFLVDTGLLAGADLLSNNQASRVTNPEQKDVIFRDDGTMAIGGKNIILLHMAGPLLKTTGGSRFFWQGMLWEGLKQISNCEKDNSNEVVNHALK